MAAVPCTTCLTLRPTPPSVRPRGWRGFHLPAVLEATAPAEARHGTRDAVRLLVTEGLRNTHAAFLDLPGFLRAGDLLVVNDSGTLPAALSAVVAGESGQPDASPSPGTEGALHLSTPVPHGTDYNLDSRRWIVEPRGFAGVHAGLELALPNGGRAVLERPYGGRRLWEARLDVPGVAGAGQPSLLSWLERSGHPIRYPYVTREWLMDTYQTVFSRKPGSAEMPSAGRPFTPRVLDSIAARGVDLASITLHTGVASLERDEKPYAEYFEVPDETVRKITNAHRRGGRVIAVGTTVVRALESAADGRLARGWTERVLAPGQRLHAVDGLLTGFHEPRASHLQMLLALCDGGALQSAYEAALDGGYLWHEFGDLHLILA